MRIKLAEREGGRHFRSEERGEKYSIEEGGIGKG
jgi:hypothetical protein